MITAGEYGLDHAYRPKDYRTFARDAVRLGYTFEVRYLCDPNVRPEINSHKLARPEELRIAREEGLSIVLIWQNTKGDALGGHSAGVRDARNALYQAVMLGYPKGCTLYFGIADHETNPREYSVISEYLSGVHSVVKGYYEIGGYGHAPCLEEMMRRGLITKMWQAAAWVGDYKSAMAHLYQKRGYVYPAGLKCDSNLALRTHLGEWRARDMMDWFPFATQNRAPEKYWGNYTGGPMKGVLHTTETDGFTPHPSLYGGWHTSYPHFTVVLQKDGKIKLYQHIPLDRAARALKNLAGGVQTNTDSAIQIEIVWRAANAANMPRNFLDFIRTLMRWLEYECSIQCIWFGGDSHHYPPEDGHRLGNEPWRMTNTQWDNFNGWCSHQNVAENVHGDTGKIDVPYLLADPEEDMPAPNHFTVIERNPVGAGYWLVEAQGGVHTKDGAPFKGSMFDIPAEKRRMDPDEYIIGMIVKTSGTSVTGYKLITNKGDGYDLPYVT